MFSFFQYKQMLTKVDIIKETVEYYRHHKRSMNGLYCSYIHNGLRCAFSRCCMDDPQTTNKLQAREGKGVSEFDVKLDELLKPEYRGHDLAFWCHIQRLHDTISFWKDRELSESGHRYVDYLLQTYK